MTEMLWNGGKGHETSGIIADMRVDRSYGEGTYRVLKGEKRPEGAVVGVDCRAESPKVAYGAIPFNWSCTSHHLGYHIAEGAAPLIVWPIADDNESTAYTDDAGDYPPLARNYTDVKVRIHDDDFFEELGL